MNISVILSTYKRIHILERTLRSFCELNFPGLDWELIIVDNADESATLRTVTEFSERLPIRYLVERNAGKNYAMNSAIEVATGELFVFTDDDVIADPNWLAEMWEGSRRWPNFSVFGGKILPDFPLGRIPISKEHPFFKSAYVLADWSIGEGKYDANHVWGPNMAIRSKIFHDGWRFNTSIGPCDNNYIMGSETELTLRLEKAGMEAVYLPKCFVYHQIRPEQLELDWLYGRAFRYGRAKAYSDGKHNLRCWFDVPRCFFRKLIEVAIKRILFSYHYQKRVHYGIQYWMTRGQIYQFRSEHINL